MLRRLTAIIAILCWIPLYVVTVAADTTDTSTYGSGSYGDCNYGSCTLTLATGGTVNLNVTPTGSGLCTVQSNAVTVTTDDPNGYTTNFKTTTTTTALTSGSDTIAASSANESSPATLAMNTWGYRVDSTSGFGAGPTSSQTNGSVPSVTFAGVPASNQSSDLIKSSSSAANPGVTTDVWYGVCANSTIVPGTYTVQVTYTAVTN